MSKGILGPVLLSEPMPSGRQLEFRNADAVEGVSCDVHHLAPEQLVPVLVALISRVGGVDVCQGCLDRVVDWRRRARGA